MAPVASSSDAAFAFDMEAIGTEIAHPASEPRHRREREGAGEASATRPQAKARREGVFETRLLVIKAQEPAGPDLSRSKKR